MRKIATLVFLVFVAFLLYGAYEMRDFGRPPSDMDDYIIENSQKETGANNAVTAVVFDYRGYDTLGEATVLFTAVAGVMAMFRRRDDHA